MGSIDSLMSEAVAFSMDRMREVAAVLATHQAHPGEASSEANVLTYADGVGRLLQAGNAHEAMRRLKLLEVQIPEQMPAHFGEVAMRWRMVSLRCAEAHRSLALAFSLQDAA